MWQYQKMLPMYRFANDGLGSDQEAATPGAPLPAAVANPYRGIAEQPDLGPLAVTVDFAFRDVFGNVTAPDKPLAPLTMAVGYYDDLIGLDSWPGLAVSYLIAPASQGGASAYVGFDFHTGQYVPGTAVPYAAGVRSASLHRAKYAAILYQLWQADLALRLRTSLDQPVGGAKDDPAYAPDTVSPARTPYVLTPAQKAGLQALAGSTHAFLTAAQNLLAAQYRIVDGQTPAGVAELFGLDVTTLLQANADQEAVVLFGDGATLSLPTFYGVRAGETWESISQAVTIEAMTAYNLNVSLNEGMDLASPTPRAPYTLKAGDTLRLIATANKADVRALATANEQHPLTAGSIISYGGQTLTTQLGDTLLGLVDRFKALQVDATPAELGAANQNMPDLFDRLAQGSLTVADYVIQKGDTLRSVSRALSTTVPDLLATNRGLINLFISGTELQTGTSPYQIQPGDTLGSIAEQHAATLEQVATLNGTRPLRSAHEGALAIPYTATLNEKALPLSVAVVGQGQQLGDIAPRYLDPATGQPATAATLVLLNRDTPGLLQPGQEIKADHSHATKVTGTDTLGSVYQRLTTAHYQASYAEFASAVAAKVVVQPGAMVACPPVHTGKGQSLKAVASTFGYDPSHLLDANRSLIGLLRSGPVTFQETTVTVGENDTFLSLISRFAQRGVTVTTDDLLANQAFASILADGAFMLPAPFLPTLEVPIASSPVNPEQIFPVTVQLEMARKLSLIHPDFTDSPAVYLVQTSLAPSTAGADGKSDGTRALRNFAQSFEQTFTEFLKVAVGQHGDSASQQVWAVDFRDGRLSYDIAGNEVTYDHDNNRAVSYFALKPLANFLVSQPDVAIIPYVPGYGLKPDQVAKQTFQSIDMDVWAQEFLAAVDLFLTPAYAVPAFRLPADEDRPEQNGALHYRRVMRAKEDLVQSIIQGLTPVFEGSGGDRANAQEALRQRLLISLGNTYTVDTVAQLPVATASDDPNPSTAPRLSGKPVPVEGSDQTSAYSLSTAKVPLVGPAATSHLTFLVKTQHKEAQNFLTLNLRYAINEMEYQISAVSGISGYQASAWLTFVLPIGGPVDDLLRAGAKSLEDRARIGQIQVPIPLRAYPAMPSLAEQSGQSTKVDSPTPLTETIGQNGETENPTSLAEFIQKLKSWDYYFTYHHQSASQDTVYVKAVFNGTDSDMDQDGTPDYNPYLFAALAQFHAVYPALKIDLAQLTAAQPGKADTRLLKAVGAFADLVEMVRDGWAKPPQPKLRAPVRPVIIYEYRTDVDWDGRSLTLTGVRTTEGAYIWPSLVAQLWDDAKQAFMDYPLTQTASEAAQASYRFPPEVPSRPWRFRLRFSGLDVVKYQSGWSSVKVTRNENLGESQGRVVTKSFIYRTPAVGYINNFTPLITHAESVNIQEGAEPVDAALDNLFNYLLFAGTPVSGSMNVQLSWRYGYTLVPGAEVRTFFPIGMAPRFDFHIDAGWRQRFAAALGSALEDWVKQAEPAREGGAYFFDLSIYAGSVGQVNQPLLALKNLYYPL